ncbi:MAG: hypothetical protein AAF491_07180 [Verrucomicrobiota bacterium]
MITYLCTFMFRNEQLTLKVRAEYHQREGADHVFYRSDPGILVAKLPALETISITLAKS